MHTAKIIDGRARADRLLGQIAMGVERLKQTHGFVPSLATILLGDDPASQIYVRRKEEQACIVGIETQSHRLDADTSQARLISLISALNADRDVHAILVQLPLPPHIDTTSVLRAIDPSKDVDGFHPLNVGLVATGASSGHFSMTPCTPMGCMMLLEDALETMRGLHAVVVGCSNIVGRPLAQLLLQGKCTVSIAHIYTRNLQELVGSADILVSAAGSPGLIRGSWIKPGAVVIDVGINRVPKTAGRGSMIVGDVCFEEAKKRASAITPVPGGVGPMTIACLLRNTLSAAEQFTPLAGARPKALATTDAIPAT
mgnify:FL=1|tara:strand:+ start:6560 stop:7498 length:939 start_codon:yes stop_codon:yes gene_type:complete